MTYQNTNNAQLEAIKIGVLAVGTKFVLYNDGDIEDIHEVVLPSDKEIFEFKTDARINTIVEASPHVSHPFTHNSERVVYILPTDVEVQPNRIELLFDEDDIELINRDINEESVNGIKQRLEELREELKKECISTEELIELQSLAEYIDPNDVELLQAAGVPEFNESDLDNINFNNDSNK